VGEERADDGRILHGGDGSQPAATARACGFHRRRLSQLGVAHARDLPDIPSDRPLRVAGAVVVRQRSGTAKGFVFLNLEDETGLVNVIVRPALFRRHLPTIVGEPFL
jgi:error-prone DNA polymerase